MSELQSPLFSVIIPAYNRADVVLRAVNSVLGQTHRDFELIVVDDGSTDGTAQRIAAVRDSRLCYIFQNNSGVSIARNTGARAAKGHYVTFLDSDDWVAGDWLASFADLRGERAYSLAFCASRYWSAAGHFVRDVRPYPMGPLFSNLVGQNLPGGWVIARTLFEEIGGYNDEIGFSANSEIIMRAAEMCATRQMRVAWIDKPLVNMEHRGSRSVDEWRLADAEPFIRLYGAHFHKHPRNWSFYLGAWGASAARLGQFSLARRYFRMATALAPARPMSWVRLALTFAPAARRYVWCRSRPYSLRDVFCH